MLHHTSKPSPADAVRPLCSMICVTTQEHLPVLQVEEMVQDEDLKSSQREQGAP